MKLIVALNIFIGLIIGQVVELSDISSLSEEAKREYFRSHLVVKGAGFGKSTYNDWNVYQGLDNQLNTEQFFSLVGYEQENSDFSKRTKYPWKAFRYLGFILGIYGMTHEEYGGYNTGMHRPYQGLGLAFFVGGIYSHWILTTNPQLMQFETAKQIVDDYNKKLIKKLK